MASSVPPSARAFLDRTPGLLGVVGTNGRGGTPHLVPVWYRWEPDAVLVWTLASRAWVKNILRDPRVGFSVQEEAAPRSAVMMGGAAEVKTGHDPAIDAEIRRICRRYLPAAELDAYLAEWSELRTIVRIDVSRYYFWGL